MTYFNVLKETSLFICILAPLTLARRGKLKTSKTNSGTKSGIRSLANAGDEEPTNLGGRASLVAKRGGVL